MTEEIKAIHFKRRKSRYRRVFWLVKRKGVKMAAATMGISIWLVYKVMKKKR